MTRYQACRALGLDPIGSAFVTFVNFMAGSPEGKLSIMHMQIDYDPNHPYQKGDRFDVEEKK